jgi:putative phosphoesterase
MARPPLIVRFEICQRGDLLDLSCRMRVAALYDIHGNLPALEAVLDEVQHAGVEQIVVGGDVLPGPMPSESLARLLDSPIPVRFIQGNGDREVVAPTGAVPELYRESMRWNAAQLTAQDRQRLANWPATLRMTVDGLGDLLFCHATPRNDNEIFTRLTPEETLLPIFAGLDVAIVVCGHTHMQFDRSVGSVRVVNAGSVGMPFGAAGAYWLLIGRDLQLRRTAYDLTGAAARIRATAYPNADEFAARNVLQPPSEAQMLDAFSHAALKP